MFARALVLSLALGALVVAPDVLQAQFEKTISTTYDGWKQLPDGSYDLVFGYMNRNTSEIEVPLGAANTIDPAPADQGQPTNFLPGRQRDAFRIHVPKEFKGKFVWTLTFSGTTQTATASLDQNYSLDVGDPEPPLVKGGPDRTIKVGEVAQLNPVVKDKIRVGIQFYPRGYQPKYVLMNKLLSANGYLDIPAGAANVRNDGYFTLPKPTKLLLFQPHMHWRGKAMQLEAIYPDGKVELLSSVPHFDSNWQITYAYKYPPVFPAGTVLHQTSIHDNSTNNKNNPDPTNWVGGGERTVDEMSIAHIDFIYLSDADYQAELRAKEQRLRSRSTEQQQ